MSHSQEHAASTDLTAAIPLYKYSPLPTPRSIRLVELQIGGGGIWSDITIKLAIFNLDEAPDFDALSYTWGKSIPAYSAEADATWGMDAVRRYPIEVDGHPLMVTANLTDALRMLGDSYIRKNARKSRHLWIDSISINQEDVHERAAQVSLMGSIYQIASNVIVWLGQEDEFTHDAIAAITALARIPRESHSTVTFADWYNQPVLMRLGVFTGFTPHMWCGLVAFLNRPWFYRVWVVQEIILAKSAYVVCGRRILPWSQLSDTISFLTTSGWHNHLSSDHMRTIDALAKDPGKYRNFLESHVNVGMAAIYLESTRAGIAHSGHKALFRYLLQVHRFCDASDPRDMIYALLGITWRDRPPFSVYPEAIVPDYQVSARDLYARVAKTMLRSYKDLRFLSHVQDPSWNKIKDLPSWVPDYSVDLKPAPLSMRSAELWKACGDLVWEEADRNLGMDVEGKDSHPARLHVRGIYLDTITDIVDEAPSPHDFRESAALDPYWMNVWSLTKGLNETYPVESQSDTSSRVEVLWRTMLSNTYNNTHPAPETVRHIFFTYFARGLARIFAWEETQSRYQSEESVSTSISALQPESRDNLPIRASNTGTANTNDSERDTTRWQRMTSSFLALLALEPPLSPFTPTEFEDLLSAAVSQELEVSTSTGGSDPFRPSSSAIAQYRTTYSDFERELRYTGNSRRLFRTRKGFLGIGSQSLRRGDEVWVLGGAGTPMVLRRREREEGIGTGSVGHQLAQDGAAGKDKEVVSETAARKFEGELEAENENNDKAGAQDNNKEKGNNNSDNRDIDAGEQPVKTDVDVDADEGDASAGDKAATETEIPARQEKEEWEDWSEDENNPDHEKTNEPQEKAVPVLHENLRHDGDSTSELEREGEGKINKKDELTSSRPLSVPQDETPGPEQEGETQTNSTEIVTEIRTTTEPDMSRIHAPLRQSQDVDWRWNPYSLIGEAYVHGAMHGEGVRGVEQEDLVRIVLE